MSDKIYEDQLKAFGIEQVRAPETDLKKRFRQESAESSEFTVKQIMSSMEGRRWMFEKLDLARVFTAPFAPGQPDVSAFLAGIQAFGQILLQEIMLSAPEEFYTMNQEAAARKMALLNKEEPLA